MVDKIFRTGIASVLAENFCPRIKFVGEQYFDRKQQFELATCSEYFLKNLMCFGVTTALSNCYPVICLHYKSLIQYSYCMVGIIDDIYFHQITKIKHHQ